MRAFILAILFIPLIIASQPQASGLPVCSVAQHASYTAYGPDGVLYPTWHPQLDPYYHCRYDHEHGSSPGLLAPVDYRRDQPGIRPVYGYAATKMGMAEGHAGFKTFVLQQGAYRWMWTIHMGTGNTAGAICVAMHSVDVVGVDVVTLEKLVDLHMMLNFGLAIDNGRAGFPAYTPPGCPTQNGLPFESVRGLRRIPEATSPATYEAWGADLRPLPALGFAPGGLYIITYDPQTICNDLTCSANVAMPARIEAASMAVGTHRSLSWGTYGPGFAIDGTKSGTYYTDPMGMSARASTDADAVQQYIKPGFTYQFPSTLPDCEPDGRTQLYWCTTARQDYWSVELDPFVSGAN